MTETKEPQSFEDAMAQLEIIVKKLENGDIPLEESIKTYERGMSLSQYCKKQLDDAETKVAKLMKQDGTTETLEP